MKFDLQFYDSCGCEKRTESTPLAHHSFHPTFQLAVLKGQQVFGYGLFHVECPDKYVPSREEQLLIEPEDEAKSAKARKKLERKRKHLLDNL